MRDNRILPAEPGGGVSMIKLWMPVAEGLKPGNQKADKVYGRHANEVRAKRWLTMDDYTFRLEKDIGAVAGDGRDTGVSILNALNLPVMVVDRKLRVQWVNAQAASMMQWSSRETAGWHCFTAWCGQKQPCRDCPAVRAFESAAPASSRMHTPDGRVWLLRACPLMDSAGRVLRVVEIAWDISAWEQRQNTLNQRHAEMSALIDNLPDMVWLKDRQGRILMANRAFTREFGLSPKDVRGKSDDDIWPPDVAERHRCQDEEVIASGKPVWSEDPFTDANGVHGWIETVKKPIYNGNETVSGVVAIARDITARKHAEQERTRLRTEVQQAQKMEAIGTLAGGVAHDFNNLLMSIQGTISYLLYDMDPSHPGYEMLAKIEQQIKNGSRLTGQLLGYARKGKYAIQPLDLNRLVRESAETFARMRKDIIIHRRLDPALRAIDAEQGQIEQVLLNLYVNAGQAMPSGGELILKTTNAGQGDIRGRAYRAKPGQYVALTVSDTGEGMDEKTCRRIFDPFFTTKEMGRGTGLGLASVYGIVKGHNGYIEVDSQKGSGTNFHIYFPASAQALPGVTRTIRRTVDGQGTILVVDDEQIVLEVNCRLFEKMGFTVFQAESGKTALEIFAKQGDTIDLVVLDMVMPHMNGGEVFDALKKMNPGVKVLLSSGYSQDGQASEILERGCAGFIQKPFDIHQVSAKISALLKKSG